MSASRNCLFLHQNFNDLGAFVARSVSSASATFPFSNILDETDRLRTWRTAGHFKISAPNNVLVFQETDGVNLTATVAVGTYTTIASFMSAVAAALQSAGTKTYTVTQDTSKRMKITTTNGTFLRLMMTAAASSGLAEIMGFSTSYDRTGSLNYTADAVSCHTVEFIEWDFGMAVNPKAVILAGSSRRPHGISSLGQVRILGSDTAEWENPTFSADIAFDPLILAKIGKDGLHTRGLRYWRVEIADPMNPLGYIELNKVYIGDAYAPAVGAVQFPVQSVSRDRSTTQKSKGGRKFSIRRTPYVEKSLDWDGLTNSERVEIKNLYEIVLQSKPFFLAIDANGVFTSNPQDSIFWMTFRADPDFTFTDPNVWTCKMELEEML